jgi:hypothetical protein
MRLSDESIARFSRIYERVRGIRLTPDAAREMATRLLTLFELLCRKPGGKPDGDGVSKNRD